MIYDDGHFWLEETHGINHTGGSGTEAVTTDSLGMATGHA